MESKAFSNVNFGIYTLLVEYSNGSRGIIEVDRLSDLKKYANYMEMDCPGLKNREKCKKGTRLVFEISPKNKKGVSNHEANY